ncbi:Uncharacterized protein GBIM_02586 [Gryllus bimaculatus]|nr:Uncharacterized protein GBIM_02586 [Gryllus bimaculatus]
MEDEGNHGNDDTRCFILSTLAALHTSRVMCILCQTPMLVFDRYPLVDGTFFLSPRQHNKSCIECNNCQKPMLHPHQRLNFFSDYSHQLPCPHCRAVDCHFVKPLAHMYIRDSTPAWP